MRHRVVGRRLSRTTAHRKAMLRNMAQSLIEHGQVRTTLPKAKELVQFIEPLITLAKKNTLHSRRLVISRLRDRGMVDQNQDDLPFLPDSVVQKLFKDVAPSFRDRNGGYTRIVRTAEWRVGDAGDIAMVQLVGLSKAIEKSATRKPAVKAGA